jgi:hypothetical protein
MKLPIDPFITAVAVGDGPDGGALDEGFDLPHLWIGCSGFRACSRAWRAQEVGLAYGAP